MPLPLLPPRRTTPTAITKVTTTTRPEPERWALRLPILGSAMIWETTGTATVLRRLGSPVPRGGLGLGWGLLQWGLRLWGCEWQVTTGRYGTR